MQICRCLPVTSDISHFYFTFYQNIPLLSDGLLNNTGSVKHITIVVVLETISYILHFKFLTLSHYEITQTKSAKHYQTITIE